MPLYSVNSETLSGACHSTAVGLFLLSVDKECRGSLTRALLPLQP